MRHPWTSPARLAALAGVALLLTGAAAHHLGGSHHRPPASAFGNGPRRSAGGAYVATLLPERPFSRQGMQPLVLQLTDTSGGAIDGAAIAVDGGMPEHRHGLPTQPRVTRALGRGRYQVDGLRFSMGGWWTLTFRIDAGAARDSVTFHLDL